MLDGSLGLALEAHLEGIREILGTYLDPAVRLSKRSHRGPQCDVCRKPTATAEAQAELNNVGDGPDLCWGPHTHDGEDA